MCKQLFSMMWFIVFFAAASAIHAQPSLKMMIPANPGGGWDQTGRNLAAAMQSAKLVSSVQFDNKGGAGGTIGLAQFINSAKGDPERDSDRRYGDGRGHLFGELSGKFEPGDASRPPHRRVRDHRRTGKLAAQKPGRPGQSLQSQSGQHLLGRRLGRRHRPHLVGLVAKAAGVDPAKINYVPYKGGGEAIAAIVGGHVTAGVSGVGEFGEQIKGGRMRALAVSSPSKMDGYPTLKEQGLDVELSNWRGTFGAPGINTQQRDALIKIIRGATESAAWKATVEKLGWSPIFLSGDEYKKFVDEDSKRIAGIIDSLGIKGKK